MILNRTLLLQYTLLFMTTCNDISEAFERYNAILFISPSSVPRRSRVYPALLQEGENEKGVHMSVLQIPRGGSASLGDVETYDFGSKRIQDVIEKLSTDVEVGLSSQEASVRLDTFGKNMLVSPPGKNLLELIMEQFEDRLVQILLCVAALSALFSYFERGEHITAGNSNGGFIKSFAEPLIILAILGKKCNFMKERSIYLVSISFQFEWK